MALPSIIPPPAPNLGDQRTTLPVEDVRVSRTLSKAIDTFEGDWEAAAEWMRTPNAALDGKTPCEAALEPCGDDAVLAVLVRIDHGVPS